MSPSKRKVESSVNPPNKKLKDSHVSDGEFKLVQASLVLSIPPVFAANPAAGANELLDSMIMRYIPSLKGVVLAHSNLKFLDKVAAIQVDCPFLVCTVSFDATVWSPRVGQSLFAKVNLCSPDHISLLVHRTFNVSIPRHHIPIEEWEFEYGPAENDPEYGKTDSQGHEATTAEDGQEIDHSSGGKWVKRMTGEPLGGQDGVLQFTVIGLTVANEMLSLLGSIQPDPFSPRHTNQNGNTKSQKDNEDKSELEESEAEEGSDSEPESDEEEEEVESDMDTRHSLGKRKDVDETSKNVGRAKDKKR